MICDVECFLQFYHLVVSKSHYDKLYIRVLYRSVTEIKQTCTNRW